MRHVRETPSSRPSRHPSSRRSSGAADPDAANASSVSSREYVHSARAARPAARGPARRSPGAQIDEVDLVAAGDVPQQRRLRAGVVQREAVQFGVGALGRSSRSGRAFAVRAQRRMRAKATRSRSLFELKVDRAAVRRDLAEELRRRGRARSAASRACASRSSRNRLLSPRLLHPAEHAAAAVAAHAGIPPTPLSSATMSMRPLTGSSR